jgi:hypothetical protein
MQSNSPLLTIFARETRGIPAIPVRAALGAAISHVPGMTRLSPQFSLNWRPSDEVRATASLSRSHQFAQSLRNPESVVANVFPADLFAAAGSGAVTVARSDLAVFSLDIHPAAGLRAGMQLYQRRLADLVLVAPETGEPFATRGFEVGRGTAAGASLDFALSRPRFGLLGSYAWQQIKLRHDGGTYAPEHASSHLLEAGATIFPTATFSIRVGATLLAGRRGTALAGALEWESCNLLDRGCEFGGAPGYDTDALGRLKLPAYLRADIGIRKHWHLRVAGRDAELAGFGSITNVFGRSNILTVARDPSTNNPVNLAMRPFAPLVLGIDWRY